MNHIRPFYALVLALTISLGLAGCAGEEERQAAHFEKGQALFEAEDYEKARVEFKNALQINRKDLETRFMLGRTLERLGRTRGAVQKYRDVAQEDPTHLDVRLALARMYVSYGAVELAPDIIEEALALDPKNALAIAMRGSVALFRGEKEIALADAREALAIDATNVDAIALLAQAHKSNEDNGKAITALTEGIKLLPENNVLRTMLAGMYAETEDFMAAESVVKEMITIEPEVFNHVVLLSKLQVLGGRVDQAIESVDQYQKSHPENEVAMLYQTQLIRKNKGWEEGITVLKQFIAANPDMYDLRFGLAFMYTEQQEYHQAVTAYQKIINKDSPKVQALKAKSRLAYIYMIEKNFVDARKMADEVLAENPRDGDALMLHGRLLLADRDTDGALADFRSVLKDRPDSAEVLRYLAITHAARNELELSKEYLQQAAVADNKDVASRFALAKAAHAAGDADKAAGYLEEVLSAVPDNVTALEALVKLELSRKNISVAEATIEKFKTENPENYAGYFFAGGIHVLRKEYEQAIAQYEKSMSFSKQNVRPLQAAVRVYSRMNKADEALAMVDRYLLDDSNNADLHRLRGQVLLALKRVDEGEASLQKAIEIKPTNTAAYVLLGQSRFSSGDLDGAIGVWESGRARIPDQMVAFSMRLAILYEGSQRYDDAIREFDAVLNLDKNNIAAMNNLAMILVSHSNNEADIQRAIGFAEALEQSNSGVVKDTAGWLYFKGGNMGKALKLLSEAAIATPDNTEIQYHLGMAYLQQGDKSTAKSHLERAVTKGADYYGLAKARAALEAL